MMNCKKLVELLEEFIGGELPSDVQVLCEHHLKICPPCVVFLETYRLTIKLSKKLPCTEMPPELARRLQAAMQECLNQPPKGETAE
jgi:hypothetical protein